LNQIPEQLRNLILKQPGEIFRTDKEEVILELRKLGVNEESQLYVFFKEFVITFYPSTTSDEELTDIMHGIFMSTEFVQETWGIPDQYICLTSAEGEGCYLYSKETESVYDFSLEDRENFILSPIPRWKTFFEFLEWFLTPVH